MSIPSDGSSTVSTTAIIEKIKEIEIPDNDPFLHDIAGRKPFAEKLFNLVKNSHPPLVICINAKWGEGKTTFLKMLERYFENNDFPTVYFDAWKNDFIGNPKTALFGEIWSKVKDLQLLDSDERIDGLKLFLNAARAIVKHQIDKHFGDEAGELVGSIWGGLETTQKAIAIELNSYLADKKQVEDCKNALETMANYIGISKRSDCPYPLVFIIDELDRCRPSFAVEILETAKHLFNAKNVIFILAVNRHQLGSTIKALYGSGDDVDGYLRKFIDLDIMMQPPIDGKKYTNHLMAKYAISQQVQAMQTGGMHLYCDSLDGLVALVTSLFEFFEFSMRDQEYYCTFLSIILKVTAEKSINYLGSLAFFLALKLKNPALYLEIFERKKSCATLWDELFKGKQFFMRSHDGKISVDFMYQTLEILIGCCDGETINFIRLDFLNSRKHSNSEKAIVIDLGNIETIPSSDPPNKEINGFVDSYLKSYCFSEVIKKIEIALPRTVSLSGAVTAN